MLNVYSPHNELRFFLASNPHDIATVCETFLSDNTSVSMLDASNIMCFSHNRKVSAKVGLAIYAQNSWSSIVKYLFGKKGYSIRMLTVYFMFFLQSSF